MTREQQAAAAQASIDHGFTVRDRLLSELDDLERTLRGMRDTVEAMPPDAGANGILPKATQEVEVKVRRTWKLWNR